jgi:hypothetical protein
MVLNHAILFSLQDGEVMEGEDTMKNLRKTFAGIFGDIQ